MTSKQIAMYEAHYPRTTVAIACVSNVSPSTVQKLGRLLDRELDLGILQTNSNSKMNYNTKQEVK